jgi:hypothetical protein
MRTYLECFSCFLDHGLDIARRAGLSEEEQRLVINRVAQMLPEFDLSSKPPEMSLRINRAIRELTEVRDPFAEEKNLSNRLALAQADLVRSRINESSDRLKTALEYAIAGNSIDFGAFRDLDIAAAMENLVTDEDRRICREDSLYFQLENFRRELSQAESLFYITDNAGEIVFDMILMETMLAIRQGLAITVAVRNSPIINDATLADARAIGLDRLVPVISSGSDAPGTPLDMVNDEFLRHFTNSDMVIAKGQGNYETLSEAFRKVHLLFKVKCPVVARHSGAAPGSIMLIPSS